MLVLSRYKGQRIKIGDDVEIVILNIQDDRVKIGIDAPRNVPVHRMEILDNKEAKKGGKHNA